MVNFAQKHKGRILNKGPYFAHGHFADAETWPFLQKRHQTGRGYIYIDCSKIFEYELNPWTRAWFKLVGRV
jgi:hypothetical protein